jgi:hypothetical protein
MCITAWRPRRAQTTEGAHILLLNQLETPLACEGGEVALPALPRVIGREAVDAHDIVAFGDESLNQV